MKAKKGVVEFLNKVLTNELTAINQYFLHAEMCGNWGYTLLHNEMRKHAIDEMKHAEQIIEHVLFLDGFPNLQRLGTLKIGETVPEQLKSDLGLEHAIACLRISLCNKVYPQLPHISACRKYWLMAVSSFVKTLIQKFHDTFFSFHEILLA